jgi:magnesium-protoporphyrin O-methyltransferase
VGRTVEDPDLLPKASPISARLLELLSDVGRTSPSVLDLGCGTGTTAIRLARDGAGPVTGVDLSQTSIDIARRRAAVAGLSEDRIWFEVADASSANLEPRDWVVLDKVICCFDDMPRLLVNASSAASHRLAFAVPDSRGWRGAVNAVAVRAENVWNRLVRRAYTPGYVHDLHDVDGVLTGAGLRRVRDSVRGLWYAAVYERGRAEGSGPH